MASDTKTRIHELTRRAAKGDQAAFGALYEQHLNAIYRYVFYRVNNEQDAEDLTERTFLKAWQYLAKKKNAEIENFNAWIYRIAHNVVIEYYRTTKETTTLEDASTLTDPSFTPEALTDLNLDSAGLAKAISQLELNYQQIIILRFVNGLSHNETAEILNIKSNHARILQYRALKKLREILDKEANDNE